MSSNKYYEIGKSVLFPICRSITGSGVRKTLSIIKKEFPSIKICAVRSGTKVFDWRVPHEWNIKDAYVLDKFNKKIISFHSNNLHVVGYSAPIKKTLTKNQLLKHLHSLPHQPKAIPYMTSYYKKYWGFCITHNQKILFKNKYKKYDQFKVVIKSKINPNGKLNYGELVLKVNLNKKFNFNLHLSSSMANNELSGPIVSMSLINYFSKFKNLKNLEIYIYTRNNRFNFLFK